MRRSGRPRLRLVDSRSARRCSRRRRTRTPASCVTQMCFCGETISNWIGNVRDKGIKLSVRVGLPGAVERKKLFAFSLRIGVGESARFSLKQPKVIRKLMAAKIYEPDDLVLHLANYVESSRFNISGLHLYTFNQVEATQRWRSEFPGIR